MSETQSLRFSDLVKPQIQALIKKAQIKAEGEFVPPPLDLNAIKCRADTLLTRSISEEEQTQIRNDVYRLICEIIELQNLIAQTTSGSILE